jgi:hypothetical protein
MCTPSQYKFAISNRTYCIIASFFPSRFLSIFLSARCALSVWLLLKCAEISCVHTKGEAIAAAARSDGVVGALAGGM